VYTRCTGFENPRWMRPREVGVTAS
jgi:hypothetical protein